MYEELQLIDSSVPIGSYALGLERYQDKDICVYLHDLPSRIKDKLDIPTDDRYRYQSLLLQHSTHYKLEGADIFVFDNLTKLNIVRETMWILNRVPGEILNIKDARVAIFRAVLKEKGFV
jgi:hypothetical protein